MLADSWTKQGKMKPISWVDVPLNVEEDYVITNDNPYVNFNS